MTSKFLQIISVSGLTFILDQFSFLRNECLIFDYLFSLSLYQASI